MLIKIGKTTYGNLRVVSGKTENDMMALLNEAVDELRANKIPLTHSNWCGNIDLIEMNIEERLLHKATVTAIERKETVLDVFHTASLYLKEKYCSQNVNYR